MSTPVSFDQRALEDVRVLIVDDHDLFRSGLRNLLEEEGVQIVGEASAGQEALKIVRELAPDVVVMDLNMPGMGGVEATRHISTIAPLTRVLMLTISDQDNDVIDAILAGACGYLLKDSSIQELIAGIRAASQGESLISPTIASKVLQRVRASNRQPEIESTIRAELSDREIEVLKLIAGIRAASQGESLISPTIASKVLQRVRASNRQPEIESTIRAVLSDREIEVLKLIANGKDNAMIAAELHISPKTVKNHISNILMKLQIDNRIQAAVYAVRSGIV